MNPSQGHASGTLVRTTTGVKRVGDVQIGDYLYDARGRQTRCIDVAPPATGKLKEITYQKFDSSARSSFTCTPNHRLTLTTIGTRPSISRNSVTWFTRRDREHTMKEAGDLHLDILSDYFYQDLSLDSIDCDCGGLWMVHRRSKTEEQAQLALKILQSDLHHLVDPLIVSDGEEFSMTVEEYERLCCKKVKRKHLKLYRAPLAFDSSTVSTNPISTADSTTISASDPETPVWLQSYIDRLNSSRPSDLVGQPGWHGDEKRIACPPVGPENCSGWSRRLGLLGDKSGCIPSAYITADEDTRLAVIAGLIDSDGCSVNSHNSYRCQQNTDGHRNIVYDLKELASSCGISVTGVYSEMRTNALAAVPRPTPTYIIYLGKGSVKFQKHPTLQEDESGKDLYQS
ncbi:hypothetical protein V1508DRAFT_434437 [Lipomyces doorenjongii]|uniref:uncharacterized protein n=1 Tax=Lipomyces doorenjongii TaxID=383834 RepID=UPI0034CD667C